jgi:ribonuclease III
MIPKFNDPKLLETAFTHRSTLNEKGLPASSSNERLEYLGDAVLELATSEYLYRQLPEEPEGVLTAFRSALVKTQTLADLTLELGIDQKLIMSKGEIRTGGRSNTSILADTMEAVLGALYLDQGFEAVVKFLEKNLFPKFKQIQADGSWKDAKSELQEKVQAQGLPAPKYRVVHATGPDHEKEFVVEVKVNNISRGRGSGKSKQQAQQEAAIKALEQLED